MSFSYGESQWPPAAGAGYDVGAGPAGAQSWDHQTTTARSGASSAVPHEEPAAFYYQFQHVDNAYREMIKSGKMLPGVGMPPGGRREFPPHHPSGPARFHPGFEPRLPGGPAGRPHSPGFAGRGGPGHPSSNLQNFYSTQRHQPSRGSNDAEQAQQHKRRLAAQRERELRNYHQEQQFNRTTAYPPGPQDVQSGPVNPNLNRPDRTFSPGGTAEVPHHELIARQHSALQGKGPFGESAGYIDENGVPRKGLPIQHPAPATNMRGGGSPLTYEYSRNVAPGQHPQAAPSSQGAAEPRERASSNASPQSNPSGGPKGGPLEPVNRTSNSSPGSGSTQNGCAPAGAGKAPVAPIGTRPAQVASNSKQSTTPLSYSGAEAMGTASTLAPSSASSTTANDSSSLAGVNNWGQRSGGPWGPAKIQTTSLWT